jgi:aminoglycoside phosphotransferase family enzyme/predicted kinase
MAGPFERRRDLDAIVSDLAQPEVYPGRPPSVEVHETHGSWVFVAGDDVLKIKRPVKLSFLDYSTLERRRAMCREEVRLNQRLAPHLYLRTVGIVPDPAGGLAMTADDEAPGVVEVGVLMRRYDESDILAARLAAGTATGEQLRAVGARIAAFHAASPRPDQAETALVTLRQAVRTTLDDLEAARVAPPGGPRVPTLRNRLEALLASRREDLLARGRRGLVVDGHGDLRLQHVLLTDPVQVLDALEFDPGLRITDVACDIGFLVMDLEGEGATPLAEALLTGYREAGGDPGDDALLALMACYRALVRAKIDATRGRAGRAQERIAQATALGWRARGPMLLAVCGPPATGKSTLAAALCEESPMVRVSSDVSRKAQLGLAPTQRAPAGAYGRGATLRTYRALGEHAAAALAAGSGAVIDATMGDAEARAAFRDGLGQAADSVIYAECRAPREEVESRARARETNRMRESDATVAIAEGLRARFDALDEIPAACHRVLRTDRPVQEIVDDLTTWLDRPRR